MDAGIQYVYNAEGRRVGKTDGTVYVVGLSGNVIDELDNGIWRRSEVDAGGKHIATETQTGTYFTHVDWLGTERGRTSPTGTLCQQTTSFSFGDGAVSSTPAGVAGCNPSPGFFTGKERDPESSLDDFGARYYSSQWGRWMSPDWSASPSAVPYSTMANPQSLNLYAYVGNDPINGEDADGHSIWRQGEREDWYNGGDSEASNNPSHGGFGSLMPPPPNFHRGVSSTLIVDDTNEGSGAFYRNTLQAQQQNSSSTPKPASPQGHFEYDQETGQMTHVLSDGSRVAVGTGYSGQGNGLNNPSEQYTPNTGPTPQGNYTIEPQKVNVTSAGHKLSGSMRLDPSADNNTHGRAGFLIHGDNPRGDHSASNGRIILPRPARSAIGGSNDHILVVVP